MLKKDTAIIVACGILLVVLIALLFFEMKNPEGGVTFIADLFGKASNH